MRKTAILFALLFARPVIAGDVFVSTATLDLGSDAREVRVVDVNGDGRPDIVSISDDVDSLNVILNEGPDEDSRFNFSDRRVFRVGEAPRGLAVGDFDNDGRADLAVSDNEEDNVRVFRGEGNGNFMLAHTLSTGKNPARMAFADLDGDGLDDLLVLENGANRLAIFMANASGFDARRTVSVTGKPQALAVADIDGDGHLDVAVGGNDISILMNDGNGALASRQTLSVSGEATDIALGDLTGDGLADLIFTRSNSTRFRVVFNSGESKPFTDKDPADSVYVKEVNTGFSMAGIMLADVTGDASLDVVARSIADPSVVVMEGTGYGAFVTAGAYTVKNDPANHGGLGDFDGDGRIDIVIVHQASAMAEFLRGLNELNYDTFTTFGLGQTPVDARRMRLDADGNDDVAVRDSSQPVLYLLTSDGKEELVLKSTLSLASAAADFEVHDVGGDGLDDILVNENGATTIRLFEAIGGGTLTHTDTIDAGTLIGDFVVGEFDGVADARPDVAVIVPSENRVRVYAGSDWTAPSAQFDLAERPTRLAAGNVDDDAAEEILVVSGTGATATLSIHKHGVAEALASFEYEGAIVDAQLVDIDGDDDLDIAALSEERARLITWINDGAGVFGATALEYETERGPVRFLMDDVDGDGDLDAVVLAAYARRVEVLYREGEVYLTHGNSLELSSSPAGGVILDVNADGRNELLVALPSESKLGLAMQGENLEPSARDSYLVLEHDQEEIEGFLAGSDPNGDDLTYTITRQPEHGTLELVDATRGYIRYTVGSDFDERDSFTYVVDDGDLVSDVATVSIYREDRKGGGGGATWFLLALLGLVPVRRVIFGRGVKS